jgi:cell wall assembly regulator SMI1
MKSIILNGQDTQMRLEEYADLLPSEQQISAFEAELGFRLPADYREFLLTYNGGVCEFSRVLEPIDGYICDLFGLYPAAAETTLMKLQLPQSAELTALWGPLPPNLLPIGEVDSGDMIALRFHPHKSEVVVIDHETDQLKVEMSENSFTEFLANTIPDEEE